MNRKQQKKIFAVTSKDRKQNSNLNVYSPAPETYGTFTSKSLAEKSAQEKRKLYNSVKISSEIIKL